MVMASTTSRPRVFFDVSIGIEPIGRIIIELFIDQAPRTCENFRSLCTGSNPPLTYKAAPFHRIIDEFMIQGGDITKGDGTGGDSIYGGEFEDENIGWRNIDAPNLLCMANHGKDTNSSQFFITLVPCEHLNGKHTVFGHVVSGQQTVERMSRVDVNQNDNPLTDVTIAHCGELERRRKPPANATGATTQLVSEARGRRKRRRSGSESASSSRSNDHGHRSRSRDHPRHSKHHRKSSSESIQPPPSREKYRRRSDATIDHNLRGRPRERSVDRSRSPVRDGTSPVHRHQRARSPEPSRARSKSRSDSSDHRRQRSLPNQYERLERNKDYSRRDNYEGDGRHRRRDDGGYRGEDRRREGRGNRYAEPTDGRLGGGGDSGWDNGDDDGIVYKGRGSMKYREKRRW